MYFVCVSSPFLKAGLEVEVVVQQVTAASPAVVVEVVLQGLIQK